MRYEAISPYLFSKNREKILAQMPQNSIAVIHSNDAMPRNGDLFFPFRQQSDFFYASGIEQEESILLFVPYESDPNKRVQLFILKPDEKLEIWEGKKLTPLEAQKISGIQTVLSEKEFYTTFAEYAKKSEIIYINQNENPRFTSPVSSRDERFKTYVQQKYPKHETRSLAPILCKCRLIKEPEEIELISKACAITREGFLEVCSRIKPGMKEYHIEAILSEVFISHGASGHAFEPIVASGKNACYLHYTKNNSLLESGTLVTIDFGAEYANYASDCTRAIPVNGEFSKRQKQIYMSVLRAFKQTKKIITAGTTIQNIHSEACKYIEEELLLLGLITKQDIATQKAKSPAYFTYFMHGVSHFLGLDTHDVGEKDVVLEPGMVLTCEPGIYVLQEEIGIRLENTILVTTDGNKDLMDNIPFIEE